MVSSAEISPGWGTLLAVVRRCENGEPLSEPDRQAILDQTMALGLATLPGAIGCSISRQQPNGVFVTPAVAGMVALLLDEVQYATDDGPCLRAARTGQPEHLDPLADDPRWPDLVRQAAEHGVRSSLSLPMPRAETSSALNLYASAEGVFGSPRTAALAGLLARATSVLLMDVDQGPDDGLSAARVHRTIAERTLIVRAQGVVMARDGVNARLAYRKLAIRSAEEASPLRDVARRVLDQADEERAAGTDVSA